MKSLIFLVSNTSVWRKTVVRKIINYHRVRNLVYWSKVFWEKDLHILNICVFLR